MPRVFYLNETRKSCNHDFQIKYRHVLNEKFHYCSKCGEVRNLGKINETLLDYIIPASEQSSFQHVATPLRNVRSYVEEQKFRSNWDRVECNGFKFPATTKPHCDCGLWETKGCVNYTKHRELGYGDNVWVVQYQRSCYRAVCQTCYLKWMARQANKATRRIEHFQKKTRWPPIHIFLSAPSSDYSLPERELRKKVNRILKEINFIGGAEIFHPFRLDRATKIKWYYSPHFHIVGYGYIAGRAAEIKRKYGWILGYRGRRDSVFQTFCYLLSHCGIKKGFHSVTWFGNLSYGKLKIQKEPKLHNQCPYCLEKLVLLYHEDVEPPVPPWQYFEGPVHFDGWHPVETDKNQKKIEPSYQYDPRREANEILKALAEAD